MQIKFSKIFITIFLVLFFSKFAYPANFSDITSSNLPAINDYSLSAATIDVDKDGDLDIFIANSGQDRLLINNSYGVFSDATSARLPLDDDYSSGAAVGNVDGDGNLDIFVANEGLFAATNAANKLLINNGSGVFTNLSLTWLPQDLRSYTSGSFGDIDGDGDLDLIVSSSTTSKINAISILINDNKTKFIDETSARLASSNSAVTMRVFLGDFDRDGDLDILAVNSLGNQNRLLLNNGTGIFSEDTTAIIPPDSNSSNSAAFADADGDGRIDYIFIANDGGQQNRLYIFNLSTSKFEDKTSTNLSTDTDDSFDAAFGDLDNDGDLDIVVANGKGSGQANKLYLNDGTGNFTVAIPAFFPQGTDFSVAALVENLDGFSGNEVFISNAFDQQNRLYSSTEIPTAVTISYFKAYIKGKKVVLKWKTETEIDNIGFNILRSESENSGYETINNKTIRAKGTAVHGKKYKFKDTYVESGKTYYYKLEDIDRYGVKTLHGPTAVEVSFKKK